MHREDCSFNKLHGLRTRTISVNGVDRTEAFLINRNLRHLYPPFGLFRYIRKGQGSHSRPFALHLRGRILVLRALRCGTSKRSE